MTVTPDQVLVTVDQVEQALMSVVDYFGLDSVKVLTVAASSLPELAPVAPDELSAYLVARARLLGQKTADQVAHPAAIVVDETISATKTDPAPAPAV